MQNNEMSKSELSEMGFEKIVQASSQHQSNEMGGCNPGSQNPCGPDGSGPSKPCSPSGICGPNRCQPTGG